MKIYDVIYILDEKKFEDGGEAFSKEVAAHLKSLGGDVKEVVNMGRKTFAAPVKRQTAGLYWNLVVDLDPAKVLTFEDKYRLNNSILRLKVMYYQAPSKNPLPPPPSFMGRDG